MGYGNDYCIKDQESFFNMIDNVNQRIPAFFLNANVKLNWDVVDE